MIKYLISIILLLTVISVSAQEITLFSKGNKVFVENKSKNENAIKTQEQLVSRLKEWAYWNVVDREVDADFKLQMETNASKGITAISWGGTSYALVGKLTNKNDEVLWESNTYKSSPNGTNGFNSSRAVVKKLMRDLNKKFK